MPEARVETADTDELARPAPGAEAPAEPERAEPRNGAQRSIEDVIAERERQQTEAAAPEPAAPEPAARESAAEPAAPEPAAPQPAPDRAAAGPQPFLAQIAAFRSAEDAEADWRRFQRAFPDLSAGKSADIQRADLGERGIYYRLRINGFDSREAAGAFCQSLQSRGQACLVARR